MNFAKLKHLVRSEAFRKIRKIVVCIVGSAVVLAGIIFVFIPGPAFVVIPAGFAILATEFEWARRWSHKILDLLRFLSSPRNLKRLLYENSLSLTLLFLFLLFLIGQIATGQKVLNQKRVEAGRYELSLREYMVSGHIMEATFENWESEFLQMGALVWLTVYLRQKGATDSHKLRAGTQPPAPLQTTLKSGAPWPVRKGGWVLKLYEHSLSITLILLFLLSLVLHAIGGQREANDALLWQGKPIISLWSYLGSAQFWFESFQNWQSEFLSVAVLLWLSVFLRERGSPQSKRVDAPHWQTGESQPALPQRG